MRDLGYQNHETVRESERQRRQEENNGQIIPYNAHNMHFQDGRPSSVTGNVPGSDMLDIVNSSGSDSCDVRSEASRQGKVDDISGNIGPTTGGIYAAYN